MPIVLVHDPECPYCTGVIRLFERGAAGPGLHLLHGFGTF